MEEALVKMVGISKSFGEIQALKNVDFSVDRQEIVGLVGDNGAGKTTLVKILTGMHRPDAGEIYYKNKKTKIHNPSAARSLGIEPVHQRGAAIAEMNIWENFFLGREIRRRIGPFMILDKRRMSEITHSTTTRVGIHIPSFERPIGTLSGGEQQAVLIGRAIHFGGELLVLDEPTSALSIRETDKVLNYVEKARRELGCSVIFITHIIRHIYPIADRFVVLWQGEKIADLHKGQMSRKELEELIIRGKLESLTKSSDRKEGGSKFEPESTP
jgi:simple sugar transport system ATP-binding protein